MFYLVERVCGMVENAPQYNVIVVCSKVADLLELVFIKFIKPRVLFNIRYFNTISNFTTPPPPPPTHTRLSERNNVWRKNGFSF